jgi:hypothetical protein
VFMSERLQRAPQLIGGALLPSKVYALPASCWDAPTKREHASRSESFAHLLRDIEHTLWPKRFGTHMRVQVRAEVNAHFPLIF